MPDDFESSIFLYGVPVLAPRLAWSARALLLLLGLTTLLALTHPEPAAAVTNGRLLLVLDSSGSMGSKIKGGTKIAAAKKALNTVVDHLPADAQVGLRVYGSKVDDENDPKACTDSELVVPIAAADKPALKAQIARYRPLGETPISYSLQQAAKDLGSAGRRTVVLVSDGKESCGEDPCLTAANLVKQGIDLKFDVIGLSVSGAARSQLQCIADKGRGTYYDADDAQQIEDSLDQLATRAFRPFQLTGTPVHGTTDAGQAPRIGAGQYTDQVPSRKDQKIWYRLDRTQPGSTLHVGLVARAKVANSMVFIHLQTPDGNECTRGLVSGYQGLASGEASSWKSNPSSACNTADHLLAYVEAPLEYLLGAPFEMAVSEEPALVPGQDLPLAEKPTWQKFALAKPVAVPVPGLSLTDSPQLRAGSYSGSILTGETQVFAVDLDWGQQLEVEMRIPERRGTLAEALTVAYYVNLDLLGAERDHYLEVRADGQPADSINFDTDGAPYAKYATTAEIRYLNRDSGLLVQDAGAVPGRQYIVISLNQPSSDRPFLVPYVLGVSVVGAAGAGAPEYAVAGASATANPSAAAPPDTMSPSDTPSPPPSTPPNSSDGVSAGTVVGTAGSALLLGVAGTGIALAVRQRRRDRGA